MQRFTTDASPGQVNIPPKDAATLILLDRSGPSLKVLMGKRHERHVFLPGRFVFPGGSVDAADRLMPVGGSLDARAEAKLMLHMRRPSAAKARGLALAAIRETFEETGLLLGSKRDMAPAAPAGPWTAFADANIYPDLSTVHFIARAITPPRRKRRYDTRFFTADASAIAHKIEGKVGADFELTELVWLPLEDIKGTIDLLAITEIILRDLQTQIEAGFSHDLPVPFYRVKHGKRVRELL
jgi:8-oxo-dGTP pyrophosphatase MutT (NUDIX family)